MRRAIIRELYKSPRDKHVSASFLMGAFLSRASHPEFLALPTNQREILLHGTLRNLESEGRIESRQGNHWEGTLWKLRGLLDQIAWAARGS